MYKPANIRNFKVVAIHKKANSVVINGRTIKNYEEVGRVKGQFKQKGTREQTANGVYVVNDNITFITWWKKDFQASDILNINGVDYQIIGTPENVELRGKYAVINLEKIEGGA